MPQLIFAAPEKPNELLIEGIKVVPELIGLLVLVVILIRNRQRLGALVDRISGFKGLGIEVEFSSRDLDQAIQDRGTPAGPGERKAITRRLARIRPLLQDQRILWVDPNPASTKNERAALEHLGVRITTAATSADAEKQLQDNVFLLTVTNFNREHKDNEGVLFVQKAAAAHLLRWAIGYIEDHDPQKGVPAGFFGVTKRPDELMHLICDIAERQAL
jgi:CheY-like chemotaxis protein